MQTRKNGRRDEGAESSAGLTIQQGRQRLEKQTGKGKKAEGKKSEDPDPAACVRADQIKDHEKMSPR